jgi:hypothetical protein
MGYWKKFQMFCREHHLKTDEQSSHDAYDADLHGLAFHARESVEITDEHAVSWNEIELLTGWRSGTHDVRCPYCGWDKERSNDTFRINRTLARADWFCHYCGVRGATVNPEGVPTHLEEAERRLTAEQRKRKRAETRALALKLWDESEPITSDCLAGVYLKARRVELPPDPDAVLRFHWRCPFGKGQRLPCMIGLLRSVSTDEPTGIHRTHIYSARHGEAERMALGELSGSAVKLWSLGGSDALAVGEGIETTLSAVQLGEAKPPAWAMTVANNLARLPVIGQVKRLTILADNDPSGTGERKAREARRKWMSVGVDVVVRMTVELGDFNDLLLGRQS